MGILSKDAIFAAADTPTETVHVEEWGGDVIVRGLTAAGRDAFEASIQKREKDKRGKERVKTDLTNFRAKLVVLCLVDEAGNRLLSNDDAVALGNKSAAAVNQVFDVARRLSGMSQEDVEEMEGNSDETDADGSYSA